MNSVCFGTCLWAVTLSDTSTGESGAPYSIPSPTGRYSEPPVHLTSSNRNITTSESLKKLQKKKVCYELLVNIKQVKEVTHGFIMTIFLMNIGVGSQMFASRKQCSTFSNHIKPQIRDVHKIVFYD